jgi:hypothetical protein
MAIFIGTAVVVALLSALLLWRSHRSFKPGGAGHDVSREARRTKLQAQEQSTRWGAGM